MNSFAIRIASALVQSLSSVKESDHAQLMDAGLLLARRHGVSSQDFLKAMKQELQKADTSVRATLTTTSGKESAASSLAAKLESHLKNPVHLTEASADLLGGAILQVADDRLDMSIRGALTRASNFLRSPTSTTAV